MAELDLVNELLTTNPNAPATSGVILLLRAETQSEFKTLRREMHQRMDGLDRRMDGLDRRVDGLEKRMDGLEKSMREVQSQMCEMQSQIREMQSQMTDVIGTLKLFKESLEMVAQQVAVLVKRG